MLLAEIFDHLIAWYRYHAEESVSVRRRLRVISTLICSSCPGEYLMVGIGRPSYPTPELCVEGDAGPCEMSATPLVKSTVEYQRSV